MTRKPESSYMKGHVVYQIYPRSFHDANGDGVGDLRGIIEKLDYLNNGTERSLGVNMIWLSPFYPSPMADFGYDISDYCNVDPLFGTLEDFRELVSEAKRHHIKLMIDFVPNHTSDQHAWFKESRRSKDDPKRDWYIWRDPRPDGGPPNNWLSVFGGPAWEFDARTGQYYMHSFLKEQPDLNWENPELREAMKNAMRFWLDLGVDGIRVDAVDWMAKDPKFRDNPPNPNYSPDVDDPYHEYIRKFSQDGPHLFGYIRELAEVVKSYPHGFMVTETYPDRRNVVEAYLRLYDNYMAEVSAPFNFEGILLPWRAKAFKSFVDRFQKELAENHHYVPIYVLGNHDNSRLATRIGPEAARTAAMMQLTLPGVAFIYYGDELGMQDVNVRPSEVQDPFEKRVPGMGLGRDPERSPMLWTKGRHAGFSTAKPWLPVAPDYHTLNATFQARDPKSSLKLYRKLIYFRNHSRTIQIGSYESLILDNPYVFGYIREYEGRRLLVLLNFSKLQERVDTPFKEGRLLLSTQLDREDVPIKLRRVNLEPHEGLLISLPYRSMEHEA